MHVAASPHSLISKCNMLHLSDMPALCPCRVHLLALCVRHLSVAPSLTGKSASITCAYVRPSYLVVGFLVSALQHGITASWEGSSARQTLKICR